MADAKAPSTESAPASAVAVETDVEAKQPAVTEVAEEPTAQSTPAMSGALQSPDAEVAKAPDAAEDAKINGEASESAPVAEAPSAGDKETAGDVDTEMNDVVAEKTDAEGAAEPTAETPASTTKATNGKRKSISSVPEHKSKKLNKKKSMQRITRLDANPGEYYFARLKSYPPWPSVICDEEMLPTSLLSTRPVTTMQADGTFKEAYGPGGKREHERTFPIMFLHTNEFAWIPNTDLTPLTPEECKGISEKGKSKSLLAAYEVATQGYELQHYKDMLIDHQRALEEDLQRQEERKAEKAAKAGKPDSKKKRKSIDASAATAEDGDVDMEDAVDDDAPAKPKSSKKRKKDAESEGEAEKPAKTPKTATKLKLTTPKAPESSKKAKESTKATKSKAASTKKGKTDEEATPAPKEPEKPADPAEAKAKKEREVLYLRHKLQKGFLSRDTPPKEEEMKTMSGYIQKLEEYEDLEVSIIRATKVNKVLKAIIKLNSIPKDEEFNFRKRSHDLLESWNKLLGAEGPEAKDDDQPTTNGVHSKDEDKEAEAEKEPAPKVAAPTDAADVKEESTLPEEPAEAKETIVDKMIDGTAASGAVAAEAEKSAEEVKNDAEETQPSTE